jgi:cytochrome c oxidase subunit 3
LEKKENSFYNFLFATILLGIIFLLLQFYEYTNCPFNINDSGYGSTFFLLTGFHGLHVLVGTVLLLITLLRVVSKKKIKELTAENHLGLECAAYYWHFVDIV